MDPHEVQKIRTFFMDSLKLMPKDLAMSRSAEGADLAAEPLSHPCPPPHPSQQGADVSRSPPGVSLCLGDLLFVFLAESRAASRSSPSPAAGGRGWGERHWSHVTRARKALYTSGVVHCVLV